jgi:DNA modification methylase
MTVPYYADDYLALHQGDAAGVLAQLDASSVQSCVTSPPYFGLRDYGHPEQIGLEESPGEYVASLVEVFRAVRRVLRDDGTVWLNLGDSYSGSWGNQSHKDGRQETSPIGQVHDERFPSGRRSGAIRPGDPPAKNLRGMPWRVAFALQDDGWILRSDIVWAKRNFMPESVEDRPTRAHEYLFLLAKRPRYYYDAEAIREESDPEQEAHNRRYAREYDAHTSRAAATGQPGNVNSVGIHSRPGRGGRNARSVWSISSQPYPGVHFAVMPPALVRRCVLAGCPEGGTVLDPFIGSGTVAMVANQLGRRAVGIDLSESYLDLAMQRCKDAPLDFSGEAS